MTLASFDLQVTLILPSFESIGLSIQKKFKIHVDFQDGNLCSHLGFLIAMILSIFGLQVTVILPTKFRVGWPLG